MKIPTLGTGQLFDLNQQRPELFLKHEKRQTFILVSAITVCVTIATYFFVIYGN